MRNSTSNAQSGHTPKHDCACQSTDAPSTASSDDGTCAPRLVLASASASRRMIVRNAGVEPICHPADIDERAIHKEIEQGLFGLVGTEPIETPESDAVTSSPRRSLSTTDAEKIVCGLAEAKAENVAEQYPREIVVGADSMLLLDGVLQGKPHTVDVAIERWIRQRGKSAQLITGHCIITPRGRVTRAASTMVHFGMVSDKDIEAYSNSGEPLPCAGAFTLEARGAWLIDAIEGDPSSVIGLSLPLVRAAMYQLGYSVTDLWSASPATP